MTLSTIIQLARTYLQTDSNGLVDSDAIILASEALLADTSDLIMRGIDAASIFEVYMNATDQTGIYPWPDGVTATWTPATGFSGTPPTLWMLKTVNVNYQDTTLGNYVEPDIVDVGNLPKGQSYQWLRKNQASDNPLLDNRGATFEIFPAPDYTNRNNNLTKFFYAMYFTAPIVYTATSSTVLYPFNLNQNVLARRMAQIQASRGNEEMQSIAKENEKEHLNELNKLETILKRGSQKSIIPQGLSLTGREF